MSLNKDFIARVGIAVSAGVLFLSFAFYSDLALLLVVFFFTALAMREYFALVARGGHKPLRPLGYLIAAGLLYIAYNPPRGELSALHVALIFGFGVLMLLKGLDTALQPARQVPPALFITIFGALYIGGSISCVINLNHIHKMVFSHVGMAQAPLLLLPFVGAWSSDTGAYLSGRIVGREKLSRISPNKTREGMIGALAAGFVATVIFGNMVGLDARVLIILGLAIPFAGLAGDLFESAIKRRFDAKDSGTFFKNHGGVLDRFDSIFFVAPLTYFLIYYFYINQ